MNARPTISVPVFDRRFVFNVYDEPTVAEDLPDDRWTDAGWTPETDSKYAGPRKDPAALRELARLLKYRTCPFCRAPMATLAKNSQPGVVLVCMSCNYWGGRGTREWGLGPADHRGVLGRYSFIQNVDDIEPATLLRHLQGSPRDLLALSPGKAEQFMADMVRDVYNCDARVVGGVKDGGVDGIIVKNDRVRTILQVKWRESSKKAESVSVVREVIGTLVVQGVPSAMIISTANKFSRQAHDEAAAAQGRTLEDVGKLNLDLKAFDDIVGMLEVATKKANAGASPESVIPHFDPDECIFDNW